MRSIAEPSAPGTGSLLDAITADRYAGWHEVLRSRSGMQLLLHPVCLHPGHPALPAILLQT